MAQTVLEKKKNPKNGVNMELVEQFEQSLEDIKAGRVTVFRSKQKKVKESKDASQEEILNAFKETLVELQEGRSTTFD